MSKLYYVGPKVEISNHGIYYKKSKEDKYVYLMAALEILISIENDYEKEPSYTHKFKCGVLEEGELHRILQYYNNDSETHISQEHTIYKQKIEHQIAYIQDLPYLTSIDKEVWIKNIEIMKKYKLQRALNKIYYMYCIQTIIQVIQHKKIKEITVPFNKNFFHVLNTIKGALIADQPSFDAKVTEEYPSNEHMILKLLIS